MADEWDDSPAVEVSSFARSNTDNAVDIGHCISRGRGFTAFTEDVNRDGDSYGGQFQRGRGGRGGGMRGRGGRGGRGGGRSYDDSNGGGGDYNQDREYRSDRGDRGDRGDYGDRGGRGGRGGHGGRGGRGGRGGYTNGDGNGDRDRNTENNEEGADGEPKPEPVTYIPPDPTDDETEMFGTSISTGINFDKFDCINVKVTGENAPNKIATFDNCDLRKYIVENIYKSGYKKPTPIQKHAIPIIKEGRDLMACAQTGSGKTAAFLIPILHALLENPEELVAENRCCRPQVVIVSPTRELTLQIFQEARKFSHGSILKVAVAYGGTAVRHQGDRIAGGCHILVATPGRLHDFVNRERLSFASIRFVVLDEADRMLDMGFLPEVEKMMEHPTMNKDRQTLMFSATFPEDIQHLASRFLKPDYLFVAVGVIGGASTDVEQEFHEVTKYDKQGALLQLIKDNESQRILVFVETKRNADFIASLLSEQCLLTTSIHGNRKQEEREQALHSFKSGKHRILVATAVAARGLDIKNVDMVVNYDLPKSIDEYVHRIGRTGRVGNRGKAVSFFDAEKDVALVMELSKILKQAGQKVPEFLQNVSSSGYTEASNYGGSDIRDFNSATAPASANEPEEDWS